MERSLGALEQRSALAGVDALTTREQRLVLMGLFADCVPVCIFDPVSNALALCHASWRGTARRVAPAAVRCLVESGSKVNDLTAVIGPCICQRCYEVGDDVVDALGLYDMSMPGVLVPSRPGKWLLDLRTLNSAQLADSGVPMHNISVYDMCTACNEDLFFSHRRDGAKTGRMAMVCWIE
jgi:hypothetical protein